MPLGNKGLAVIFAAMAGMLVVVEGLITKATTSSFNEQVTQLQDRAHALGTAAPSQCFYIDEAKPLSVAFSAYKHKGFWIGASFEFWYDGSPHDGKEIGTFPNLIEAPCLKLADESRLTPTQAEAVALKGADELLSGEKAQALRSANPSGWLTVNAKP
jgi:hypothetical protein